MIRVDSSALFDLSESRHIFFDPQLTHLQAAPGGKIPMVHVPFGIANRRAGAKGAGPATIAA
ncbi:5'-nucleotidase [Massilia sp. ST3]|uniref:5'-nucleotidase n=1 Tax=Massilia sp. ST3 TaxID=2824903 RepID=UPI001E5BD47A|nr:5'-nucleotidase [Massilia sp. ST3]